MQLLQTKISNFKSPQSIKRLQFLKEERDNLSRDKVRNIREREREREVKSQELFKNYL